TKSRMTTFTFTAKDYPTQPGCYLMKDKNSRVMYVGKAKNLRRRVASYFQQRRQPRRIRDMVRRIADIELIIVNNETESLILENNLIKHHRPRSNRALMRDNSGYYYIILTDEPYPRFLPYKKNHFSKALENLTDPENEQRFGPYLNKRYRDTLLAYILENFKLRDCDPLPKQVCLLYHMHRCSGPCADKITKKAYQRAINKAIKFLGHRPSNLLTKMRQRMMALSDDLEYERAQRIKNQIDALEATSEKQIVEQSLDYDYDILYFGEGHVLATKIAGGALIGMTMHELSSVQSEMGKQETFIRKYYKSSSASSTKLITNQIPELPFTDSVIVSLPSSPIDHALMQLCRTNLDFRVNRLD
ncbi:MAG: GIY-YIG nuclease family protein, partial [Chloroflexota bacterium]